jgi:NitT/TauT family transport system substrate-binding protein
MKKFKCYGCLLSLITIAGCSSGKDSGDITKQANSPAAKLPVFTLATSEYPSWSTYMVAGKAGMINPEEGGKHGPLETKHGVDLVLLIKDYDTCLTLYANSSSSAVCMTNMDSLNPALGRPSTVVMPTSQSLGADKVIAVGITKAEELKGVKVYGLAKSVSEYLFVRGLEVNGLDPEGFSFENLDPAPAATALQTGSEEIKAICVWNPFAMQTLRTAPNANAVFDSSSIPEEIIDCVVIGNDVLKQDQGADFAVLVCDVFYEINKKIDSSDAKVADATLTALGEDFSNLPLADMREIIKETKFYMTPADGIQLFADKKFQTETMPRVVSTCEKLGILEAGKSPSIGFGDSSKQLNFDSQYMQRVADNK